MSLSFIEDGVVVAARNNESVLTHALPYYENEEEAVVFSIKRYERDPEHYLWKNNKITRSNSSFPLWLRCINNRVINMTNDYQENERWELPHYLEPQLLRTENYYVWINGIAYIVTHEHMFSLRVCEGRFKDKNGRDHGEVPGTVNEGHYIVGLPSGKIVSTSRRGLDSTQVIQSTLMTGVTTGGLIDKLGLKYGLVSSSDTRYYIRKYPDIS